MSGKFNILFFATFFFMCVTRWRSIDFCVVYEKLKKKKNDKRWTTVYISAIDVEKKIKNKVLENKK